MRSEEEQTKAQIAAIEFYAALGNALSSWQKVEGSLFLLFMLLSLWKQWGTGKANDASIFSVMYHSIGYIDTKIKVIDQMLKFRAKDNQAMIKRWGTLQHRIRRKKDIRDKFAHWETVANWQTDKFESIFLSPALTDSRNFSKRDFGKPSSGVMRVPELQEHAQHFLDLSKELAEFTFQHLAPTALQEKSA